MAFCRSTSQLKKTVELEKFVVSCSALNFWSVSLIVF